MLRFSAFKRIKNHQNGSILRKLWVILVGNYILLIFLKCILIFLNAFKYYSFFWFQGKIALNFWVHSMFWAFYSPDGVWFLKLSRYPQNFFNMWPFLTRPVPIESCHCKLSIGTGLINNGHISKRRVHRVIFRNLTPRNRSPSIFTI